MCTIKMIPLVPSPEPWGLYELDILPINLKKTQQPAGGQGGLRKI